MRVLSEEVVYKGKLFSVVDEKVDLGNEIIKTFEIARRSPGTRLIIINQAGQILLSKEYRKELGNYHFRLSGGKVFDTLVKYGDFLQSGNDIQKVAEKGAIKEAPEEVGIQTNALEFFAKSVMRFLHNK